MKVLVLGGTGAMGIHVCRVLSDTGNDVFVTTRRELTDSNGMRYVKGDAKDPSFLSPLLDEGWDAVIDFMIWTTDEFKARVGDFLSHASQYVFLSSYRVYADSPVITEDSPRLLDVVQDVEYLATDEYALAKARCENALFESGRQNWTIARPAVTYDGVAGRMQLAVLEAVDWLWRAQNGIPIPLPEAMLGKQATMTWGGDVARMIVGLIGNSAAVGEVFTVATSDHMTWGDVAKAYQSIIPLELVPCDLSRFERYRGGVYQIRYDRMFDRIIDNSKILHATGINQAELTTMECGLFRELNCCLEMNSGLIPTIGPNARLDRIMYSNKSLLKLLGQSEGNKPTIAAKYLIRRYLK